MEITREQVEKWVEEQRIKNDLRVFEVSSTIYLDKVRYTVHKTEEQCDVLKGTWEQAQKSVRKPLKNPRIKELESEIHALTTELAELKK